MSARARVIGVALAVVLLAAILALVVVRHDPNPCSVLAERRLFTAISDVGGHGRPLVEAVSASLRRAGLSGDLSASDLDPIIRSEGNLVHVGVRGYFVELAEVSGGYVPVSAPRLCSTM